MFFVELIITWNGRSLILNLHPENVIACHIVHVKIRRWISALRQLAAYRFSTITCLHKMSSFLIHSIMLRECVGGFNLIHDHVEHLR